MKKIIYLVIFLFVIVVAVTIFYINRNEIDNNIKAQVIQFDVMDNSEKIVEEISVQVNDILNLKEYDGNNIKILEINDKNVKISRDARRYKIKSQTSIYSGEVNEYVDTVVETIEYDTLIMINIDSRHPFGPEYSQPRYYYNVKFIKG